MRKNIISIGMPVYNDVAFLSDALDSLLEQSYTDFELIISDDCSTDGSALICETYAKKDSRIRYILQKENLGISKNMKFLLNEAQGKFFMWAADDDLWDKRFIETLVSALEQDHALVVAFCPMVFIGNRGEILENPKGRCSDYSGKSARIRLTKLIEIFDDSFGYGLFRRKKILGVEFPTWFWINKKCAYNNIYPSLCYYLTVGNYECVGDKPLWFNRLKSEEDIHHKIPYYDTFLRYFFALTLRKMNLVMESVKMINKANGSFRMATCITLLMLHGWILKPIATEIRNRLRMLFRGQITFL